jgi:glycosyltransferase involved in cell wall biosynthesis
MKIKHIIPTLGVGGAEEFVVNLAIEQSQIHEVSILIIFGVRGQKGQLLLKRLNDFNVEVNVGGDGNKLKSVIISIFHVLCINSIIHVHLEPSIKFIYYVFIILKILRNKLVLTIHSNFLDFSSFSNFMRGCIFNEIVFCSEVVLESQKDKINCFRNNYHSVNNGVPSVNYELKESVDSIYKFVCIAGFRGDKLSVSVKNQEFLIRSAAKLKRNNCQFIFIGDGPTRAEAEKLALELDAKDKVSFLGNLPDPYKFYDDKTFTVISSRSEGLPIVLLESIVRGISVISCDLSEIKSLEIPEINYYTSNCYDSFEILINKIVDEERKSSQVYLNKNKFSIERCCDEYENVYKLIS